MLSTEMTFEFVHFLAILTVSIVVFLQVRFLNISISSQLLLKVEFLNDRLSLSLYHIVYRNYNLINSMRTGRK